MKKKLLATVLMVGLLAAQTLSVSAAPSKTTEVASKTEGIVVSADGAANVSDASVKSAIEKFNDGSKKSLGDLLSAGASEQVKKDIDGKKALTSVIDVSATTATKDADGKYVVTLSVPALNDGLEHVKVLHYVEGKGWEILTPSNVNTGDKTITVKFASLSPVLVVADVKSGSSDNGSSSSGSSSSSSSSSDSSSSSSTGATSPKTGETADYMVWFAAAAVLGVAAVVAKKQKRA